MHYYSFNIGDYASHTRHLTPMEDLVYRRLLDLYYLSERPLSDCSTTVARLINLRGQEAEVDAVLVEFFEHVDGVGYINKRADQEISRFHDKLEAASRAGKASAQQRLNKRSTDVQPNNNQEPINNNQEPKVSTRNKVVAKPDDIEDHVWNDWLQLRKAKKAPVTETVVNGARKEATKAGMSLNQFFREWCLRGSQGLKAEWIKKDQGNRTEHQKRQDATARALFGNMFETPSMKTIEGEVINENTPRLLG